MVYSISNTLLCKYPSGALKDSVTYGDMTLQIVGEHNAEKWANVDGTVVGKCKLKDCEGNPIEEGDKIITDYRVVAQYTWVDAWGKETFQPDGSSTRRYTNRVQIDGQECFKVQLDWVIAVKRGNKWVGVGEFCVLKELEIAEKKEVLMLEGFGAFVDLTAEVKKKGKATFISGEVNDLNAGDVVMFDERHKEVYETLAGEKIIVLPSRYIMAKYN